MMAYTPRVWTDGEVLGASEGPNRWETALDSQDERITTLEGAPDPVLTVNGTPPDGEGNVDVASGGGAVDSVNGQTGAVVLSAASVDALPDTYEPAWDDILDKPTIPATPQDIGAQPAGDYVLTVNDVPPDPEGNVEVAVEDWQPPIYETVQDVADALALGEIVVGQIVAVVADGA
jgi:hypothetical protein